MRRRLNDITVKSFTMKTDEFVTRASYIYDRKRCICIAWRRRKLLRVNHCTWWYTRSSRASMHQKTNEAISRFTKSRNCFETGFRGFHVAPLCGDEIDSQEGRTSRTQHRQHDSCSWIRFTEMNHNDWKPRNEADGVIYLNHLTLTSLLWI